MRYRENTEFVIKNLSFTVNPKEKIGIAGRTGSGKTTLTQILFRITEIQEGLVIVDGVELKTLGLHLIRNSFCIIP